jgi:hypothetical protein
MAGIPRMQNRRLPCSDKKNELFDQLVATIERHFGNGETSQELETGAWQLVQAGIHMGIIDPAEANVEAMVREYARRGWTLRGVLDEIDGKTRGLPSDQKDD